jgi:hypothetical protein
MHCDVVSHTHPSWPNLPSTPLINIPPLPIHSPCSEPEKGEREKGEKRRGEGRRRREGRRGEGRPAAGASPEEHAGSHLDIAGVGGEALPRAPSSSSSHGGAPPRLRMKTVGNGRKRTYDIENENGRFGIFLHLAIKEYKKWLKMVVKPIETDNFSC